MDYEEFKSQIFQMIQEILAIHQIKAEATLIEVPKNNDVVKDAIVINGEQKSFAPAIYPEQYFTDYENGRALESIVAEIMHQCLSQQSNVMKLTVNTEDYHVLKDFLQIQLVSRSTNEEMLKSIVHHDVEHTDLTAIMRVKVLNNEGELGTFKVDNKILQLWGISADELYQDALANVIQSESPRFENILESMLGTAEDDPVPGHLPADIVVEPYEIYVLTNTSRTWGASVLLYPDVLQQIAVNAEMNLFILPSSTHELIVLGDTGHMSAEEMQSIVVTVNGSELAEEDVLSNEVYFYDRETQLLSVATQREKTNGLENRFSELMESRGRTEDEEAWER